MLELLILGAAGIGIIYGHVKSRQYVRTRLRFVDAAHHPLLPWIAGAGAAALAAPVVWVLPVVGAGTALLFGVGVGSGVALGARDVKRLPGS